MTGVSVEETKKGVVVWIMGSDGEVVGRKVEGVKGGLEVVEVRKVADAKPALVAGGVSFGAAAAALDSPKPPAVKPVAAGFGFKSPAAAQEVEVGGFSFGSSGSSGFGKPPAVKEVVQLSAVEKGKGVFGSPATGGFGALASKPAASGFGVLATQPAASGFGAFATQPAASGFGTLASKTGGFGSPATPSFGFGSAAVKKDTPVASGFGFGSPAPAPSPAPVPIPLVTAPAPAVTSPTPSIPVAPTAVFGSGGTGGFSFGGKPASTGGGFSFGSTASSLPTPAASTTPAFRAKGIPTQSLFGVKKESEGTTVGGIKVKPLFGDAKKVEAPAPAATKPAASSAYPPMSKAAPKNPFSTAAAPAPAPVKPAASNGYPPMSKAAPKNPFSTAAAPAPAPAKPAASSAYPPMSKAAPKNPFSTAAAPAPAPAKPVASSAYPPMSKAAPKNPFSTAAAPAAAKPAASSAYPPMSKAAPKNPFSTAAAPAPAASAFSFGAAAAKPSTPTPTPSAGFSFGSPAPAPAAAKPAALSPYPPTSKAAPKNPFSKAPPPAQPAATPSATPKPATPFEETAWVLINDFASTLSTISSLKDSFPTAAVAQQTTQKYDELTTNLLSLRSDLHTLSSSSASRHEAAISHISTHDDMKRQTATAASLLSVDCSSAILQSQPLSTQAAQQQQTMRRKLADAQKLLTNTKERLDLHTKLYDLQSDTSIDTSITNRILANLPPHLQQRSNMQQADVMGKKALFAQLKKSFDSTRKIEMKLKQLRHRQDNQQLAIEGSSTNPASARKSPHKGAIVVKPSVDSATLKAIGDAIIAASGKKEHSAIVKRFERKVGVSAAPQTLSKSNWRERCVHTHTPMACTSGPTHMCEQGGAPHTHTDGPELFSRARSPCSPHQP